MLQKIDGLPFASKTSLWDVRPTGDYAADNRTGRQYAEALVLWMQTHEAPCKLAHVIDAMGDIGGIEVGFFSVIAQRACRVVVPVVRAG